MNTGNFRLLRSSLLAFGIAFCLGAIAISAAQAGEIKQTMSEMKRAVNGAMNSSSISEFAAYAAQLEKDAIAASKLSYSSDPETYRKGIQALQPDIELMNLAIKANDLKAAKEALRRMNKTKKIYHDQIG